MPTRIANHANMDVFAVIAHPVRRAILDRLRETGPTTVSDLAEPFKISRPAVSQHLAVLGEAGLVSSERQGRENYYHLQPEPLNAIHGWLQHYERFWTGKLDALDAYLEAEGSNPDEA